MLIVMDIIFAEQSEVWREDGEVWRAGPEAE